MERGEPFTDPDELIAVVEAEGIPLPTVAPLWSYLDACAEKYRVPDPPPHRHRHRPQDGPRSTS